MICLCQFVSMAKFDKKIIGRNVKLLRESLGLSQVDFSHLVDVSPGTITNLEYGRAPNSLNTLEKFLIFFGIEMEELLYREISIPADFRESIINKHKTNKELINLLHRRPTIVYAIKFKLLKSDFLDKPKEIGEVKAYFEEFGWSFLGTSISNALKRMPDLIEIRKHPTKLNTNEYFRKR